MRLEWYAINQHPEMMNFFKANLGLWIFALCLMFYGQARADDFDTGRSAYISGDYETALKILKPLAEQGDPEAEKIMGMMYDYGHGVDKDKREALKWYIKAAEQGNPDIQYHVGAKYFHGDGTGQDYVEAARWWELAAAGGQVDAQFNLGLMYYRGMVKEKDDAKAAQLFREAAEQGHGDAQYVLGLLYSFGQGVEKNYKTALQWFRKSSEQGVARAQFNMGVFYENGYGVDKDLDQARKWYERASAQGLNEATDKLAELSPAAATEPGETTENQAAADNPAQASKRVAASQTAPRTRQGIKREDWVLSQPADSYTLQIGSVTDEQDIIKFIRENHLENEAAYIQVEINGVTRYNAVLGVYGNYSDANKAISSLPADLRNIKPWVRNFGILQKMLN